MILATPIIASGLGVEINHSNVSLSGGQCTNWKKNVVPALWAFGCVAALVPAVVGPVLKGEPINYTFLVIAAMFFVFAVVFYAAGRKSGGRPGA